MPQSHLRVCLVLLLLTLGCSSNNSNTVAPQAQTLIGVNPSDFMAKGACGTQVLLYVATLRDMTGFDKINDSGVSAAPFVVGSSLPTPCDSSLVFSDVMVSHAYEVDLDGYDNPDAGPLAPGTSSAMVAGGQYIPPRWKASCNGWTDADGGVWPGLAYANTTVILRDCTKLGLAVN